MRVKEMYQKMELCWRGRSLERGKITKKEDVELQINKRVHFAQAGDS